jgi:hypothetical protein
MRWRNLMIYPAPHRRHWREAVRILGADTIKSKLKEANANTRPRAGIGIHDMDRREIEAWLEAENRAASGRALGLTVLLTLFSVALAWATDTWVPLE